MDMVSCKYTTLKNNFYILCQENTITDLRGQHQENLALISSQLYKLQVLAWVPLLGLNMMECWETYFVVCAYILANILLVLRIFRTRITTLLSQGLVLLELTLNWEWHLNVLLSSPSPSPQIPILIGTGADNKINDPPNQKDRRISRWTARSRTLR